MTMYTFISQKNNDFQTSFDCRFKKSSLLLAQEHRRHFESWYLRLFFFLLIELAHNYPTNCRNREKSTHS